MLAIGTLTLTPDFDPEVTEYTATTTNTTNKITATPKDPNATVTIESEDATIAADGTATWAFGENEVTITVTNGGLEKVYTVTVKKLDTRLKTFSVHAETGDITLDPEFDPDVYGGSNTYLITPSIFEVTNPITLSYETADPDATVTFEGVESCTIENNVVTYTESSATFEMVVRNGMAQSTTYYFMIVQE